MRYNNTLTAEYLRSRLNYDSETGTITWKNGPRSGRPAGNLDRGYIRIRIRNALHLAHRLVYVMMTGEYPPHQVDHIDRQPLNLRWKNLRPATHCQNSQNVARQTTNTSGYAGVNYRKDSDRWVARINVRGARVVIGTFKTKAEAIVARYVAERFAYGDFSPKR